MLRKPSGRQEVVQLMRMMDDMLLKAGVDERAEEPKEISQVRRQREVFHFRIGYFLGLAVLALLMAAFENRFNRDEAARVNRNTNKNGNYTKLRSTDSLIQKR